MAWSVAVVALLSLGGALSHPWLPLQFLLGWSALAFGLLSLAYAGAGARLLLKRADGSLAWPGLLLFAPYHGWSRFTIGLVRLKHRQAYHEIVPGLYLGRKLRFHEGERLARAGLTHVLDLTAELQECLPFRRLTYRVLPVLDMTGPSQGQLREAMEFLDEALAGGSVYVHCAVGHGRSATVVAAYLLWTGRATTPEEAVRQLKAIRPRVRLSPSQWQSLAAPSTPGGGGSPGAGGDPPRASGARARFPR